MHGPAGIFRATLNPSTLQYHYWEAHLIGAPLFPADVKFVLGVFPDLFGTAAGLLLRQWCACWGRTNLAT